MAASEMSYYRKSCRRRAHHGVAGRVLDAWQTHCEDDHGASDLEYRRRVHEWHRENHPDCTWVPNPVLAALDSDDQRLVFARARVAGQRAGDAVRRLGEALLGGGATKWR